jgi:DHA1 family bicyclomycin/chloramphenicol resistance-like MFS transporter
VAVSLFTVLAGILVVLELMDAVTFPRFMALLGGAMFLVGMIFSNFNSLAMEPQGHIAGTASSLFGSITTVVAAVIGYFVGQAYDGTLLPLALSYLAFGVATLAVIAVTERGRLFG